MMPLYEFECVECGNRFEYLVRSTGEKTPCPGCGGDQIKKLFSAFSHRSSERGKQGQTASSGSSCSSCSSNSCATCGS